MSSLFLEPSFILFQLVLSLVATVHFVETLRKSVKPAIKFFAGLVFAMHLFPTANLYLSRGTDLDGTFVIGVCWGLALTLVSVMRVLPACQAPHG
jgi:hypothetical protein